ncbi:hypothetical protein ACJMK2_003121 [Sinanodonta woodiana]|uniref:Death domain-containing protein n=1 Tax=Sinanodonta woodiana TaxID=1069815 RepID=A0ABD3XYW8_SINWO
MDDIEALGLLYKDLQSIQTLPNPPQSYDGIEQFEKTASEVIDHACDTTQKVAKYGDAITEKLEEMRSALKQSTTKIQEQIKKSIDYLAGKDTTKGTVSAHSGTTILYKVESNGKPSSKDIELINRLQNLEIKKQRLEEFIIKTQQIMEKVKQGASVTNMDIDQMRGCLGSWLEDKKESYQEEQDRLAKKQEEENRRKKEEEDKKREKDEKNRKKNNKKEEAEQRKKDEDERRKREEEERLKKEEEERKRKEDEIKRKEEEDLRKQEEEERLKREEAERKQKEDEERKKKQEEDRIKKEMEQKRREEEEKKKREAKRKEEEERRRKDPANWTPHTYRRPEGESDSFHRDICCHVFAMPDTLQEEDLECFASDEWHDNEELSLGIGEKVTSCLTEVKVKVDEKELKVPMRICVPHCSVSDSSDEVIVKVSIDGGEWKNQQPVTLPSRQASQPDLNYAGIDVANFRSVKVLAVAKTKSQEFLVDKSGISQASSLDKNIKLFVPRDTFRKPKKMKLEIRPIRDNSLTFATQYYDHCHNVLSTSSVMAITCEALTEKDIELDLTRNAPNDKRTSDKGRYLHLYKCRGDNWKIADSEIKGKNMDVSINLPSRKDAYVVLEIEGRLGIPNDEFIKAADELYFHSNASIVRVVAKQRAEYPHSLMIQCVRRDQVSSCLSELERKGYSTGPDTSKEFVLIDGQAIILRCSGNITMTPESEVKLIFHAYMDTAKQEVTLQAIDEYKQKEFEGYVGHLQFEVLKDNREGALYIKTSGSLPINLPKRPIERPRTARARIRFPHYLTTLAKYLAMKLTVQAKDDTWLQVIFSLGSRREMENIRRRAATRCETPHNEYEICEIILQDWMKSKPVQDDKIKPILRALEDCHRMALSNECEKFIHIHKKYLSDECMSEMAKKIANDWSSLARKLGLSEEDITSCKNGSKGSNEDEAFMMLCKWRTSEAVVNSGIDVFNDLLGIVETMQNLNGLKEYVRHTLNQISKE